MARKIRFGVVRNGEHLSLHAGRDEAEAAAEVERISIQQAAADGWTTQNSANRTRVWVEEVRRYVW